MSIGFAWSLVDRGHDLHVYCLLIDNYYAVATQWPRDEASWLTRRFLNVEEANAYAIHHTSLLEKQQDEWVEGPIARELKDQAVYLDRFVDMDAPSATLDFLYNIVLFGELA